MSTAEPLTKTAPVPAVRNTCPDDSEQVEVEEEVEGGAGIDDWTRGEWDGAGCGGFAGYVRTLRVAAVAVVGR